MPQTLTPTTMLGAVNELLTAIGTVPVNTLDAPGSSDVAIAKDTVESVQMEVLSQGWWFNTEYARSFSPTGNEINLPSNIISARPSRGTTTVSPETRQFVVRDGKLYNPIDSTHTFSTSVRADVIASMDFSHMPESARRYITVRAARVFQTKVLGDEQLGVFTAQHEMDAWQILQADHAQSTPVSDMYMQRVRRMGRMMRADPFAQAASGQQQGQQQQQQRR